jgi:hypothetical protein
MLTRYCLDAIQDKMQESPDCSDCEFIQYNQNWVEKLHEALDLYNHTPKTTTHLTPLEVHFPEVHQEPSSRFVMDDGHTNIFEDNQIDEPQESQEEIWERVHRINCTSARKYLEKAQKKKVVRQRDVLSKNQVVVVRMPTGRTRKKNDVGKSYFPFSGVVEEVVRNGERYKIKWGVAPGNNEKSGQISKKRFKRNQLLPVTKEFEGLTVQHYQNADSWNSYDVKSVDEKIKEVLRERTTSEGFLEALCVLKGKKSPKWKPVTSVAECDAYVYFQKYKVIFCT